ncbi:sensor histidine kinase [Streptomyces sp. NPDC093094]|uniref:sensor histidine kinase n=1 Tax=Streptomyces sp. NPDC093094 TaxID=3366026 RepID=UPI00380446E8
MRWDETVSASRSITEAVQTVFLRITAVLRVLWGVLVVVTVLWPASFSTMPWAAFPVALAGLGWAAFVWFLSRGGDCPTRHMAWMDALFFTTTLMGQASLVPPSLIGDGTNWVFAGASLSLFIACLLLTPTEAVGVLILLIAGYLSGIIAAGGSALVPDGPGTSFVLLMQCLVGTAAVRALRGTARRADAAMRRELADEHVTIIESRREAERQAQEVILHDKVRATLWLVGDGWLLDNRAQALESCRRSLSALRDLREGHLATELAHSPKHGVEKAVTWARSIGLDVEFTAHEQSVSEIPEAVSQAVGEATRQALANVRAHSGTVHARVEIVTAEDSVQVTVRDDGRGFNLDQVGSDKQGVRESITERMGKVGGHARVRSGIGLGTTVLLDWKASPPQNPAAKTPGSSALALSGSTFVRLIITSGLVYHGLSLYALIHFAHDYVSVGVALAAWCLQLAAGTTLALGIKIGRLHSSVVWGCVAATLLASAAVVVDCRAEGVLGFANWAFGDSIWPLSLAVVHLHAVRVVIALGVHDAVQTVCIFAKVGGSPSGLLKLGAILLENMMLQAGFAVGFYILIKITRETVWSMWKSGIKSSDLQAKSEERRSRQARAARFDSHIRPLLKSVADGIADPNDMGTRRRFQAASLAMRHEDVLAELNSDTADLTALAAEAGDRSVRVDIRGADDLARFPPHTRRSMLTVMATALTFASPGRAVIGLHADTDMTALDWEVAGHDRHHQIHSITLVCHTLKSETAALRTEIELSLATSPLLTSELDVDDEPDSPTAEVWLAVAGRP